MTYSSCRSYLLNVDQLTDVHVVVTAAHIRPHGLHHLPNHGHNDVSPGQRQGLAVQQLLEQRHHVAVVGRAGEKTAHLHPFNIYTSSYASEREGSSAFSCSALVTGSLPIESFTVYITVDTCEIGNTCYRTLPRLISCTTLHVLRLTSTLILLSTRNYMLVYSY